MPFQIPPSKGSLPVPGEGRGNLLSQVPFYFQASCIQSSRVDYVVAENGKANNCGSLAGRGFVPSSGGTLSARWRLVARI